jgi:Zn-dependent peptidase ImmA (M78 family)/transcriptional regulator with XRE-family HTH domain
MIYGERVRQVREMHRLTQAALAAQIPGLPQWRLSRIETGLADAENEVVAMLAAISGVTTDFLGRPPSPTLVAHTPHLRARSRLTQGAKAVAIQWARLVDEAYEHMASRVSRIPVRLSRLHGATPEEAAAQARRMLGFQPHEPLPYLVLAVERIGVRVLGLPPQVDDLDAFCAWHGDEPLIALVGGAPGDRQRFSVAHELGHLLLHAPDRVGKNVEVEADRFAAELLTPRVAISAALPRNPTLNSLAMLKTTWGSSVKSLIRRARELGVIDQERSISLYKQISARGWNRQEPGYVPVEKPRAFRKMAEISYGPGPNVQRLAADLGWSEELTFLVLAEHATSDDLPHQPPRRCVTADNVVELRPAGRVGRDATARHHGRGQLRVEEPVDGFIGE